VGAEAAKSVGYDNTLLLFKVIVDRVTEESVKELAPPMDQPARRVDVFLESQVHLPWFVSDGTTRFSESQATSWFANFSRLLGRKERVPMKAIVMHEYGDPEVLKFEDYPDPTPGPGEVLVKVAATSINPIDLMQRSGAVKDFFPVEFPGIIGRDLSGTIRGLGPGVDQFSVGDRVFAVASTRTRNFASSRHSFSQRYPMDWMSLRRRYPWSRSWEVS
jgi:hypothetical protein